MGSEYCKGSQATMRAEMAFDCIDGCKDESMGDYQSLFKLSEGPFKCGSRVGGLHKRAPASPNSTPRFRELVATVTCVSGVLCSSSTAVPYFCLCLSRHGAH